jgi:hypothetical protein
MVAATVDAVTIGTATETATATETKMMEVKETAKNKDE